MFLALAALGLTHCFVFEYSITTLYFYLSFLSLLAPYLRCPSSLQAQGYKENPQINSLYICFKYSITSAYISSPFCHVWRLSHNVPRLCRHGGRKNGRRRTRSRAIDPIGAASSSQSSSDLSSPNESCYSFVRRALQVASDNSKQVDRGE
ncbi:hypothetical protein E2C01_072500 [Portunus trituberculatus]|uniref:Uncharacterized protein n=1 Tax=Portunus trituberculatus TaxID=210409 RepID=A0A5B7I940_PORTR|nr:hypothetical protein [Portunus trituberculatus]